MKYRELDRGCIQVVEDNVLDWQNFFLTQRLPQTIGPARPGPSPSSQLGDFSESVQKSMLPSESDIESDWRSPAGGRSLVTGSVNREKN